MNMFFRITLDYDALANEIVAKIPEKHFVSDTDTFLDPAFAGGQLLKAVAKRLHKYGHSVETIRSRLFGYEDSIAYLNHPVNYSTEVIANLSVVNYGEFLEKNMSKRFDVIIGNPPYQSGNGERGGRHSLWRKIIAKSFEIVNKNGCVAMVCPGFPLSSNDLGPYLKNNTPIYLNNDSTDYFPGIGSDIKSWIVKEGIHDNDFIVDGKVWKDSSDPTIHPVYLSIVKKIQKFEKFECKYDGGYNSTQLKNDKNEYFETPTGASIYPIRHGSTVKVAYVSKPTRCHNIPKVMMTFSGYPGFEYSDKNNPMSSCLQMSGYIEVANKIEGNYLINLYSTKFYTFLSSYNSKGMRGKDNYSLPKLSLDKTWVDEELYARFNLTQEEIEYIEANVK